MPKVDNARRPFFFPEKTRKIKECESIYRENLKYERDCVITTSKLPRFIKREVFSFRNKKKKFTNNTEPITCNVRSGQMCFDCSAHVLSFSL